MIGWFVFIFMCYAFLMIALIIGYAKIPDFKAENNAPKTTFSIIIPFRNEAENLPTLLQSLGKLNYPTALFEILFVDDASSDASVATIYKPHRFLKPVRFQIFSNKRISNSPKKDAITTAINQAKHQWILTTDADCIVPENWLQTLDAFIRQKQPKMVVAPVDYEAKNTFLEQFQHLDFLSLQGATISGFGLKKPFLCNGANLAYQKESFLQLNGFEGNNDIASGDDIFLFEKFVQNDAQSVQFIKSLAATVKTFPVSNWKDLIQQRVRWAAKTGNYQLPFGKFVGAIVFLTNFSLVIGFLLVLFKQFSVIYVLLFFVLKLSLDVTLFLKTTRFFTQEKTLYQWFLPSSFLYPFFSVTVVFIALFSSYQWKGRDFKK